jgi:hypothetical protein
MEIGSFKAPVTKPAEFEQIGIAGVWTFSDGTDDTLLVNIKNPADMDKTEQPSLNIYWATPTTSSDCKWQIKYLFRGQNEALNATQDDTITTVETSSSTAYGLNKTTVNLSNLSSSDEGIILEIKRLGADAEDTLDDDAHLISVEYEYIMDKLGD